MLIRTHSAFRRPWWADTVKLNRFMWSCSLGLSLR